MNLINRAPLVRLLLPFIVGIVAAIYMGSNTIAFAILIITGFLGILIFTFHKKISGDYRFRWLYGLAITGLFFFCGYQLTITNTAKYSKIYFGKFISKSDFCLVQITEPLIEKEKSMKMIGAVISVRTNNNWKNTSGNALFYLQKDSFSSKLKYGDLVLVKNNFSEINAPKNPSEYDLKKYFSFQNIYLQNYISSGNCVNTGINKGNFIRLAAINTQQKFRNILKKHNLKGQEFAVTAALLLGYRNDIDNETESDYVATGAVHVLCVAGLHVGIIFAVFNSLLLFLEKFRYGNWIKGILLLAMLWFYAMLTGLSPSVLRAATMLSFVIVANVFNRNRNVYNTLAASAFLLLVINPYLIMAAGFQLSYISVIGIVSIFPWLYHLWKIKNKFLDKILTITAVSIASQLVTFPLAMYYFHEFPNYFLLANLFVIPLATLTIYSGILLFITEKIAILATFFSKILSFLVSGLNFFVKQIHAMPYSQTVGISINPVETYLIYFIIIFMLMYLMRKKIRYLFLGFGILIFLLTIQVFEQKSQQNQRKLIVYNIPKMSACDFIQGKNNFLIADTAFLNNKNAMMFHVIPNWWDNGITAHTFIGADSGKIFFQKNIFLKNKYLQFASKKIFFLDGKIKLPEQIISQKLKVDYVIVSHNPKMNVKIFCRNYAFKKIIFDASNSKWKIDKWLKECEEEGVEAYSVVDSGAYEETI